jgi:HK97 family phage major capsid protein/HK97 family phage prohead protease
MLNRACATLDIKGIDLDTREIDGIATTCAPDHAGDCVESSGAQFTLPMPLLWQHDQARPVGEVYEARVEPGGIRIKARFAKVEEAGILRDRLDEAWQSVRAKLVRGLSIGFKPLDYTPMKSGGRHIKRWLWAELSAVTIPMNVEATILNIKAAAREGRPMNTYSEQITALENSRAAALATMTDLMAKAGETGVTLDPGQASSYDEQETRVKSIDADLARVRALETFSVSKATPVPASPITPRPTVVQVKANVPKGTAFVRMACAKLVCNGNMYEAAEYAKRWNDSTPEVSLYLKAAVAPGTTTDATWAQPLVNQNIATDFLELLRPATILGKIPGLRNVPFNTKVPAQTAGGTYGWVGEQKPKPVTKLAFSSVSLGVNKIAGIIVLTEELVRLSNPKAEDVVRRDMIAGIAQFMDAQFIDPAVAAVAGVNPASITNGAPTAAATANPLADIMSLIAHFTTNNIPVDGLSFIMSPGNALSLSFRTTVSGDAMFPGITTDGGSYRGINFVTSNAAGTNVIAVQPAYVLYADDGGVTIDASREASLQMDSAPASPVDATTVMVSLWQANCVGLRAERFVTWNKINANAVKYLTAAAYPAPSGALEVETPAAREGRQKA